MKYVSLLFSISFLICSCVSPKPISRGVVCYTPLEDVARVLCAEANMFPDGSLRLNKDSIIYPKQTD